MRKLLAIAAAALGVPFVLAVAGYLFLESRSAAYAQRELGAAPGGWADSVRYYGRLPDLAGLAAERSDSGDGAALLWDSTLRWTPPEGFRGAFVRLFSDSAATAADTAVWAAVVADTALNRLAVHVRRREWRGLEQAVAASATDNSLLDLAIPRMAGVRDLEWGVLLRGLWRLNRRDVAGARADFAAATALGVRLVRDEASVYTVMVGRRMIANAMRGYERLAAATRDTALAARAAGIRAWAGAHAQRFSSLLALSPQAAATVARDTALVPGVRLDAMAWLAFGHYTRPSYILRGMGSRRRAELLALRASPDPVIARLAGMVLADADRRGFWARLRGF
jgi:hypothetical protein